MRFDKKAGKFETKQRLACWYMQTLNNKTQKRKKVWFISLFVLPLQFFVCFSLLLLLLTLWETCGIIRTYAKMTLKIYFSKTHNYIFHTTMNCIVLNSSPYDMGKRTYFFPSYPHPNPYVGINILYLPSHHNKSKF